jgi:2TM domain
MIRQELAPSMPSNRSEAGMATAELNHKRELRIHLRVYLAINGLLVVDWAIVGISTGMWFPWPLFPIVSWGIGIALLAWWCYHPQRRQFTQDPTETLACGPPQTHR